jgi:hypothetical protein
MSSQWHQLLHKNRTMDDTRQHTITSTIPKVAGSEDPHVRSSKSCPRQKDNEAKKGSLHRRTSFQRSALRDLRVNQKEVFHTLKQSARKAENQLQLDRRRNAAADESIVREHPANQIQAAFRGYACRMNLPHLRPKQKKRYHRRMWSEITMDNFGDSLHALGSLELSPGKNMERMIDSACCFQSSTSTHDTFYLSESEFQDSFSTIFSQDSLDAPARIPSRRPSPLRPSSIPLNYNVVSKKIEEEDLTFPCVKDESEDDGRYKKAGLIPTLKNCPDAFRMDWSGGHASYSSFFSRRDEPVTPPKRSRSPVPTHGTNIIRAGSWHC